MSIEWNNERKNIPARFGKSFNGQGTSTKFGEFIKSDWKIFSPLFSKRLQFKGTEVDINGTESTKNQKLPNLLPTATWLIFARLGLFKGALKQLKRRRKRAHTCKSSLNWKSSWALSCNLNLLSCIVQVVLG